jgi:hypothetical protein
MPIPLIGLFIFKVKDRRTVASVARIERRNPGRHMHTAAPSPGFAGAQPGLRHCAENNAHIVIGKEDYFLSANGALMPTRKDQPPPDLHYFKPRQKSGK